MLALGVEVVPEMAVQSCFVRSGQFGGEFLHRLARHWFETGGQGGVLADRANEIYRTWAEASG